MNASRASAGSGPGAGNRSQLGDASMRVCSNRHDGDASVARNYTGITWVACQNSDLLGAARSDDGTEMSVGYRHLGAFPDRRGSVGSGRVEDHVRDPQAVGEGPRGC